MCNFENPPVRYLFKAGGGSSTRPNLAVSIALCFLTPFASQHAQNVFRYLVFTNLL